MSTEKKPTPNEDEYFARRDAELIEKQRRQQAAAAAAAERRTHYMKCPKCGHDLATVEFHGVQIDRCPNCDGVWLDHGELDRLLQHHDPGIFSRVFGEFFRSLKAKTQP